MIPQLLAMLSGASGTSGLAGAGSSLANWGQLGQDMGANFLERAAAGQVSPSASSHAQHGWDYAKAPDMSQYATIGNTESWTQPHQQRPQMQMGQMDMIQPMSGYQNQYLRSLILGV